MAFPWRVSELEDRPMELGEHLDELRARLLRVIGYLAAGMVVGWVLYNPIYHFLSQPLRGVLPNIVYRFNNIPDAFLLKLQISFVIGLILALPFATMEGWGFIRPALTPEERKPVRWIAPSSIALFVVGVALSYLILPAALGWFATFLQEIEGAELLQDPRVYILFVVKMMLAFGVAFQLPLLLMGLASVGIVTSEGMKRHWRQAVVGISVFAGIVTPSTDFISLLMMILPLFGLYALSIGLVARIERRRAARLIDDERPLPAG